METDIRIVFMGTPAFAAASLEAIIRAGFRVVVVVTAPDKPSGRGQKLSRSEVKVVAEKYHLPILQPLNLSDPEFARTLSQYQPDVGVVVAFRILPESIYTIPGRGTFNLHASLLPQYRGAAPIHHVLINGEKETGVTTFFLDKHTDTGNIIFQEKISIDENETYGELHDRLMNIGARLVIRTLEAIRDNQYPSIPQDSLIKPGEILKKAPRIFKNDCRICWDKPTLQVHNLIRGLSPDPGAFCFLRNSQGKEFLVKIYRSYCEPRPINSRPGTITTDGKSFLKVSCLDGELIINELKLEGRKTMAVQDFLNGYRVTSEWQFL